MNAHWLINAVTAIDKAVLLTPEPIERAEIQDLALKLRTLLQKRGVFLGKAAEPPEHWSGPDGLASNEPDLLGDMATEIVDELYKEIVEREATWHDSHLCQIVEDIAKRHLRPAFEHFATLFLGEP